MNYVKSLAKQLGPRGIRVNGVAPGPIWTPLQISGGSTVQKYTNFGSTTSLGRPGQPAVLASIYVQLAAKDASFTTGNIYGAERPASAAPRWVGRGNSRARAMRRRMNISMASLSTGLVT